MTWAVPAAMPETRPEELTVAAAVLSLDQVTVRPESALPLPSLGLAVSCVVPPARTVADEGETDTEATGTMATVITEVPLLPSHVAMTWAAPAATPVTMPLELTVAAAVLSLDHVTVRPPSVLPFASSAVAIS